ncbi:tyrosine-type recombinase/integrase [Amycolatopsis sp. GM8]|uniref:tyrosine-type recombinase/integrase n=1 Tax=Amycolatopsis sp. GM8 TaxID=2896530 RepID=UPI0035AC1A8D
MAQVRATMDLLESGGSSTAGAAGRSGAAGRTAQRRACAPLLWVTSHTFRKTTATALDDADVPTRPIADQVGHARVSMTQDVYLGRK